MTELDGPLAGAASAESPGSVVAISGALHSAGLSSSVKRLSSRQLDPLVQGALGSRGYVLTPGAREPILVIEYQWGDWTASGFPPQSVGRAERRQAIERIRARAVIAGGGVFAKEFQDALFDSINEEEMNRQGPGGPAAVARSQMSSLADPVARFSNRTSKHMFLTEQATRDCYFIIISAYAYDLDTAEKRQRLWRTTATVSTAGISARDAIPMLIQGAAPWYGVPTTEAEIVTATKPARGK